jgi:cation diffusion facilitator CzcD-associated flavoprotein CzcO
MDAGDAGAAAEEFDVVIVGAGFSGLGMAIRLKQRARERFVVLEQGPALGGTWRENDYPGCACDVPSDLYSYSFALHAGWSKKFAPQQEILAYLNDVAARFGVAGHVRCGRAVASAVFDDAALRWTVTTTAGEVYVARHVVFGVGALHRPRIPPLPGRERFAGVAFHSSQWRHDVELGGKRVAVVGTGASAIQFVPAIARSAAQLVVFQRTPPWILPKVDRDIGDVERAIKRLVPGVKELSRVLTYLTFESRALGFVVDRRLMTLLERLARWHMKKQVPDRPTRKRWTPTYTPGCKRLLLSNVWYPALKRENVVVVDRGVASLDEGGVVDDGGGHHGVDVVVFATGFDVAHPFAGLDVRGRGGRTLAAAWRDGIAAYKGTHVAGFPNLSILMGPNTGLGHSSMILMIESQIRLVLDELDQLARKKADAVDVTPAAMRRWNDALQPRLQKTVWASGCSSWYLDDRGHNGTAWPGFTFQFAKDTRKACVDDLEFAVVDDDRKAP